MAVYLFAVPLAPGKTETWKNYVKELKGPRSEEHRKSRQKHGIKTEQVFLQRTPDGDMVVVRLEGDDPMKSFEGMLKSQDPFDTWFRDKIMIESHGFDPSQVKMTPNEQILFYQETPSRDYVGTGKNR